MTSLSTTDRFVDRHLGTSTDPNDADLKAMLAVLGKPSLAALIGETVPGNIALGRELGLPPAQAEHELLELLRVIARKNQVARSFLGMGYYDTRVPLVILRNVLENPGWYTAYTPYQAEIAQGRLEALLNFQTMVSDLTALPCSNASLLDEGTAAAEAMHLCKMAAGAGRSVFFVDAACHPQTLGVVRTRAEALGVEVEVGSAVSASFSAKHCGVLLQYPATDGAVVDPRPVIAKAKAAGALVVMAADILGLTLLTPPGELGADVAVGSTQRFGVPMGFGGPHAAYMATTDQHKRLLPGRIIGVSKDARGKAALRLAMQTREQHIRREKASSNICTAQVLLAVMASMYAVYHGPKGLKLIAERVRGLAGALVHGLGKVGLSAKHRLFFDTVAVTVGAGKADEVVGRGNKILVNLRKLDDSTVGVALDEGKSLRDVQDVLRVIAGRDDVPSADELESGAAALSSLGELGRRSTYLTHPVFNTHHGEHEMLRYLHGLEQKDVALNRSMIPLGSCTMKLNATAQMVPVTWPEMGQLHPFAPAEQTAGYRQLFSELEQMLCEITGFAAVSLQPNAGSQGEYAGLLAIAAYHRSRGDTQRTVCLIPQSAHGTNPASAVLAGMRVQVVACDERGNIDLGDLEKQAAAHGKELAALMVTYPSTHGVFEASIKDICKIVHAHGGQVYLDGANMNAQVGLCRPGDYGADVCHLNLHKTFAIPHGGGGPGMGPIGVQKHLAPFLPGHPLATREAGRVGPVSAAPWGSAGILPISWMYLRLLGAKGVKAATEVAILNANYMAKRLEAHYPVLYKGEKGTVAHEFILDLRPLKDKTGISAEDVAKRLMDFGFHAPTMSFPVPGTLMIEPTESEPKAELDRFCEALIAIKAEIDAVGSGVMDKTNNPLKNAPHAADVVCATAWDRPYTREQGAYPLPWVRDNKYWPPVGRIDNAYGDRNLVCICPPIEAYGAA